MMRSLSSYLFSVDTTKILRLVSNGTNNLKELMAKATKTYVDPNLNKIEKALETIKKDFGDEKENKEARRSIEIAVGDLKDAKEKIFYLKTDLDLLANVTIKNVVRTIKSIKKFQDSLQMRDETIELRFEKIVRKMINLIDESEKFLTLATEGYEKAKESLRGVDSRIRNYKADVESLLDNKDGKLDEWIDKLRAKAYGGSAACIVFPIICPVVYAAAATGVEVSINNAKKQLSKQKKDAKKLVEIIGNVLTEVENGRQFIRQEYPLIKQWESEVNHAHAEMGKYEYVLADVRLEETDELEEALLGLKEVCETYLSHSVYTLLIETTK